MQKSIQLLFISLLTIVFSALMYYFSTGLNFFWPLVWFAPLPIFLFGFYQKRLWLNFLVATIAYFLGGLSILNYPSRMPLGLFTLNTFIGAISFAVILLLSIYLMKKSAKWWSIFLFPALTTILEYLMRNNIDSGTLGSLAYTQVDFRPLIQMVSLTGIWAVTFLLSFFASTISFFIYFRRSKNHQIQTSIAFFVMLFLLIFTLIFGALRLLNQQIPQDIIKIGVLSIPESIKELKSNHADISTTIANRFINELPRLKNKGAEIILLPEKILQTNNQNNLLLVRKFQQAAKDNHVMLVFGLRQNIDNKVYNTEFVISPEGKVINQYHKEHMLPASESYYTKGKEIKLVQLSDKSKIGLAICKDMDFITPAINYSKKGAGLLLVPALDFWVDAKAHQTPAIFRGIEGGYSLVRAAQWGLLTITNQYGEIIQTKIVSDKRVVSIIANVPVYKGNTFYAKYGDWFIYICYILAIFSLLWLIFFIIKEKYGNFNVLIKST